MSLVISTKRLTPSILKDTLQRWIYKNSNPHFSDGFAAGGIDGKN
jgi:hypothetical protein